MNYSDNYDKKTTRRTTGARGCYFQTSSFQVTQSKFQTILNNLEIISHLQVSKTYCMDEGNQHTVEQVSGNKWPLIGAR